MSENSGGAGRFDRSSRRVIVLRLSTSAVAFDPDKQSGPRCVEISFFVALGNGEHGWQCLYYTCGVTIACFIEEVMMQVMIERGAAHYRSLVMTSTQCRGADDGI
jgi:hypothetical protein